MSDGVERYIKFKSVCDRIQREALGEHLEGQRRRVLEEMRAQASSFWGDDVGDHVTLESAIDDELLRRGVR